MTDDEKLRHAASCERSIDQGQHPAVAGSVMLPGCMTIAQLTAEVETLRAERDAYRAVAVKMIAANKDNGLSYWVSYVAYGLACDVLSAIAAPGATAADIRKAAGLGDWKEGGS